MPLAFCVICPDEFGINNSGPLSPTIEALPTGGLPPSAKNPPITFPKKPPIPLPPPPEADFPKFSPKFPSILSI